MDFLSGLSCMHNSWVFPQSVFGCSLIVKTLVINKAIQLFSLYVTVKTGMCSMMSPPCVIRCTALGPDMAWFLCLFDIPKRSLSSREPSELSRDSDRLPRCLLAQRAREPEKKAAQQDDTRQK